MLVADLSAVR